jgi:hypothetical protein
VAKLNQDTFFGHVLEHVALELSHLIRREVYFGKTLWAGERVVEHGDHDTLLADGGQYADLYTLQASAYAPVQTGCPQS